MPTTHYNPTVVKQPNAEAPLREFKGIGRIRERDGDSYWFPVEFLIYFDGQKLKRFAYVRRVDGRDLPDGHYFFQDDLGERTSRWRKWKGSGRSDGVIVNERNGDVSTVVLSKLLSVALRLALAARLVRIVDVHVGLELCCVRV